MRRRAVWGGLLFAVLVVATAPQTVAGLASDGGGATEKVASATGIKDEGVGTYTDASVANQVSNFTINREMVSCGVGTVTDGRSTGPFAMLMYATAIRHYRVEAGTITVTGRMRSITHIGGRTVEDVEHDFLAIAVDAGGVGEDRFDVHFSTPFWNQSTNPMCTASEYGDGRCRFGGKTVMGEVVAE